MLETLHTHEGFCNICSHLWTLPIASASSAPSRTSTSDHPDPSVSGPRFDTLDHLIRRCGLRRDEVATLAEIGALNAFGFDRRTALWQVEQAVRPAGELFEETRIGASSIGTSDRTGLATSTPRAQRRRSSR